MATTGGCQVKKMAQCRVKAPGSSTPAKAPRPEGLRLAAAARTARRSCTRGAPTVRRKEGKSGYYSLGLNEGNRERWSHSGVSERERCEKERKRVSPYVGAHHKANKHSLHNLVNSGCLQIHCNTAKIYTKDNYCELIKWSWTQRVNSLKHPVTQSAVTVGDDTHTHVKGWHITAQTHTNTHMLYCAPSLIRRDILGVWISVFQVFRCSFGLPHSTMHSLKCHREKKAGRCSLSIAPSYFLVEWQGKVGGKRCDSMLSL